MAATELQCASRTTFPINELNQIKLCSNAAYYSNISLNLASAENGRGTPNDERALFVCRTISKILPRRGNLLDFGMSSATVPRITATANRVVRPRVT